MGHAGWDTSFGKAGFGVVLPAENITRCLRKVRKQLKRYEDCPKVKVISVPEFTFCENQ
jgi:hypothetical protein